MVSIIKTNYSKDSAAKLDYININDGYKLISDAITLPTVTSNYVLEFTDENDTEIKEITPENIKQYIFIQRITVKVDSRTTVFDI